MAPPGFVTSWTLVLVEPRSCTVLIFVIPLERPSNQNSLVGWPWVSPGVPIGDISPRLVH